MSEITATTTVTRSDAEISCEVNGGYVLMNAERNEFYDMNSTATAVWELLAEATTVTRLRDDLAATFEVDPAVCEREVVQLLTDLTERGMVRIVT